MTKKNSPRLVSNVQVGAPGLDVAGLRNCAQANPTEFIQRSQKLIDSGELSWSSVSSLSRLWGALNNVPVDVRINLMGQQRTVTTSAFPVLSGNLTVAGVNAAYEDVPTIGDMLVTDRESNKKNMTIVGILSEVHNQLNVKEGESFPLVGAGEERFDIGHDRKGLRMQITQEMIEENDLDGVVDRVNALGTIPGEEIEEKTLRRVLDIDGSDATAAEPYVLHINRAGTQLYNATANSPGTRAPSGTRVINTPLVDTAALEAARQHLTTYQNSRGKRIANPVTRMQLVVPDALAFTAQTLMNSTLTPGVRNEANPWGPEGSYRPTMVSSPKIDDLTTVDWWLGDFKRQFVRKWKLRMELVTMDGDLTNFLRNRIAFEARVAWDVEVGAQDYVYVVQMLSGATAPTA